MIFTAGLGKLNCEWDQVVQDQVLLVIKLAGLKFRREYSGAEVIHSLLSSCSESQLK